jgi:hypothetical protein
MRIEYLILVFSLFSNINTFTTISNYVSTSSFTNMNYNYALQTNNGQEGYIGVLENGIQKIKKYDLSGASAVL